MRIIQFTTFTAVLLSLSVSAAAGQTIIHGKLLSMDGSVIPNTVISIDQQNPGDIFSGYDDINAGADGSYRLTIHESGMYNITFRGIYHQRVSIPFLIIDQPSIEMDVLLFPIIFDDGRYFKNEEYLKWIRVVGNFNHYDFRTGIPFTLNDDGSISAFIPVASDTVRYQVRGVNFGNGGYIPLPLADEYNIRHDRSFESVLYRNLPADSIEIRYVPGQTAPFQRHLPAGVIQEWFNANGFISFQEKSDRHWVEPIRPSWLFRTTVPVIEKDLSRGLSVEKQIEYQEKHFLGEDFDHFKETQQRILSTLKEPDIHPQQRAILSLGYAALLNQMEMRKRMLEYNLRTIQNQSGEKLKVEEIKEIEMQIARFDEIEIDKEIIMNIPDLLTPVHPAWNRAQGLPEYLLGLTEAHPRFLEYFTKIVEYHPSEFIILSVLTAIIRLSAPDYNSVEEMEVYRVIVERFGDRGDKARRAQEIFRASTEAEH